MSADATTAPSVITSVVRFLDSHGATVLGRPLPGDSKEAEVVTGDVLNPSSLHLTGQRATIHRYLPPIFPLSIQCIGLNYTDHAKEAGMKIPNYPVLFFKNLNAAHGHEAPIVIPKICQSQPEIDYEAELGVVIGRAALNVPAASALDYVLGYVVAHDVSARDQQLNQEKAGTQWNRGKGFDTFAPFGPALVYASALPEGPQNLTIQCRLNGEFVQDSNTSNMIFSVAEIISYLSQSTTLLPGTLILTGTPAGVGFVRKPKIWLKEGDVVEIIIEKLGTLRNTLVNEK